MWIARDMLGRKVGVTPDADPFAWKRRSRENALLCSLFNLGMQIREMFRGLLESVCVSPSVSIISSRDQCRLEAKWVFRICVLNESKGCIKWEVRILKRHLIFTRKNHLLSRELSKAAVKESKTLSASFSITQRSWKQNTCSPTQKRSNGIAAQQICQQSVCALRQFRLRSIRYLLLLREPISICAAHLFFASIPFLK